jgi:hypothetical protein
MPSPMKRDGKGQHGADLRANRKCQWRAQTSPMDPRRTSRSVAKLALDERNVGKQTALQPGVPPNQVTETANIYGGSRFIEGIPDRTQ